MTQPGKFPDAEKLMMALVSPYGYACTHLPPTPEEFEAKLPIIFVSRNGGACDGITDRPVIQVAVISHTRAESQQISSDIRDDVLDCAGTSPGGLGLIDSSREITGVTEFPDVDPQNREVQATYTLSFRRKR